MRADFMSNLSKCHQMVLSSALCSIRLSGRLALDQVIFDFEKKQGKYALTPFSWRPLMHNSLMTDKFPTLIATSVVRGSQQGESHGGIYTIDFQNQSGELLVDWNTSEINFEGRGADRGLRGICFDGDDIYVAASDELFCYDRDFQIKASFKNKYLKHCHEIMRKGRRLFLTSTGFDSILSFNLDSRSFDWGFRLSRAYGNWNGYTYDPQIHTGPAPVNDFHINSVFADDTGIYLAGLHTQACLHLNQDWKVTEYCSLPTGVHNAQPWRGGILFNDTQNDAVRHVSRDGRQGAFRVKTYAEKDIQFAGIDDSKVARQGFGRGLCVVSDRLIAGGSSPSTITLYDLETQQVVGSVNLSMDIRNAIHGLEVWPYA